MVACLSSSIMVNSRNLIWFFLSYFAFFSLATQTLGLTQSRLLVWGYVRSLQHCLQIMLCLVLYMRIYTYMYVPVSKSYLVDFGLQPMACLPHSCIDFIASVYLNLCTYVHIFMYATKYTVTLYTHICVFVFVPHQPSGWLAFLLQCFFSLCVFVFTLSCSNAVTAFVVVVNVAIIIYYSRNDYEFLKLLNLMPSCGGHPIWSNYIILILYKCI